MRFHFGDHVLDPERRELQRGGAPVAVEPQVFDLLFHLVRNRDRVLSKEDLVELVWGGRSISDTTISSRIKTARRAVGDNGAEQRVIRTMARKGVRFVAEVRQEATSTPLPALAATAVVPAPSASPRSLALPNKPSIAVLPFTNMSSDPEQEYFADGIAEDVITALSRYPSLFVIARNSSFTYKGRSPNVTDVGRDLGVRYVLEGSVRKSGDRIRVTGQLIEAETGNHLWAERYDRQVADIFAVQDEITAAVTIAIAPAVADAERQRAFRQPPGNLDALAACQRGSWHLGKSTARDAMAAESLFRKAIDLDPGFAGGYRGLAWTLVVAGARFQLHNQADALRTAEALARQAVALDGTDAEALACLSGTLLLAHGDYPGARAAAERAVAISPNLAAAHGELGRTLIFAGEPRDGLASVERSIRLDPRDALMALRLNQMAIGYYFCRDYKASAEAAVQAIRTYPEHPLPYRWLAASLSQTGAVSDAGAALAKAVAIAPTSFDVFVRRRARWHRPEDYAHMLDGLRKAGWEG